ncbi:hypothetical protein [Caloranaerobacter sp. DY30410]|uniref:hypothetical protein n=1 Tax=Caloranaerobacter sp. DY30410 TaxID=3238305 RepID=UPI003CFD15A9
MEKCEVKENCLCYIAGMGKCWFCENYSEYRPRDKSILSPAQIERKERRKQEKKEKRSSEASKRGKRAKRKGYAGENEIVKLLKKYNIPAERVPLSGALKGKLAGDINCIIHQKEKKIESKRRKDGFKELYRFLEQDNCNYVFMRADRKDWIVAMTFNEWLELVKEGDEY